MFNCSSAFLSASGWDFARPTTFTSFLDLSWPRAIATNPVASDDARISVRAVSAPPRFFRVTKRLHNWLHGQPGDGGQLGAEERRTYEQALAEIRSGRKQSHWMWYIFPQFDGLGFSSTSKRYAIKSLAEAKAYLGHPVLGPRLLECADVTPVQTDGFALRTLEPRPTKADPRRGRAFASRRHAPPASRDRRPPRSRTTAGCAPRRPVLEG